MSRSRGPYSNCKSCGKAIVWLTTRAGKSIPVLRQDNNEQPVRPGETFDRVVHIVHFADCKEAAQHRKPREDKAAYVRERSKGAQSEHHCHARGCKAQVPPAKFMCPRHWAMIPAELQRAVWQHFRPGQEISKDPGGNYLRAAKAAIDAVAAADGIVSPQAAERLPIFGLSMPQPWAWAVAWGGWRLLYQPWVPNRPAPWWIAIHATTEYDQAAADWLTGRLGGDLAIPPPHQLHRGHVVAVARYSGIQGDAAEGPLFAAGPDVWIVDSVVPINPIPCPPGRALWVVPGDVLVMLRAAAAAAKRAPLDRPPPVAQTGQPDYQWTEQ